jgi:hypothetical protein
MLGWTSKPYLLQKIENPGSQEYSYELALRWQFSYAAREEVCLLAVRYSIMVRGEGVDEALA